MEWYWWMILIYFIVCIYAVEEEAGRLEGKSMKKFIGTYFWIIFVIVVTVVIVSLVADYYWSADEDSFTFGLAQNFISDLVAGVILGLYAAYYIQKRDNQKEKKERRDEIFVLLKAEILFNQKKAVDNAEALGYNQPISPGMKTGAWEMYINSGQLRWMSEDLKLLHIITKAYHAVQSIRLSEEFYMNAILSGDAKIKDKMIEVLQLSYIEYSRQTDGFLSREKIKAIDLKILGLQV